MKFDFEVATLGSLAVEAKLPLVANLVEALTSVNIAFLKSHETVRLYESEVRYELMPWTWLDIPAILTRKRADCKSLVAWRLAELRVEESEDARIHFVVQKAREHTVFHVQIQRANGRIEDPSRRLGMRARERNSW